MKKMLAMMLILVMAVSMTACGGDTKTENSSPETKTEETAKQEEVKTEEEKTVDSARVDGVEIPVDKYPFLEGLVLPDDAVVTEVDDQWYEEDGVIDMIVKPMDADKVAAYMEKLEAAGYKDAEVSGLVSPDYKFELLVGDMWIDMGYINLTIYDTNSDGGNSLTGLADLDLDGIEIPAEAGKYVGTVDFAYAETPELVRIGLRNADDNAFERLTDYYELGGGILDEGNSTSSEKVYGFSWGSVRATHFGADEEITIEIITGAAAESETPADKPEGQENISLSEWMKTKTGKFYSQFTSGQMTIEYQMESDGQLIRMKNASKDGKMFIENYEGDKAVACSVIEGETMYIIDHTSKMIITMGLQEDLVTVANSVIEESDIDMSELKEGTREINGKTYDTEEWIIDDVATTMCFDGGDLKYIITNPDGTEAFLEILSYSKDVDESLFEIPTDYMTFSM